MDTHMTHLELEPTIGRTARLPDEPDVDTPAVAHATHGSATGHVQAGATPTMPAAPRKRRGRLLSGVAMGALIMAGTGWFLLSPVNWVIPVPPSVFALAHQAKEAVTRAVQQIESQLTKPDTAAQNSVKVTDGRPAPAARGEPVVAPAASLAATRLKPRPETVTTPRYAAKPSEQSLDEVLALGAAKPPASSGPPQAKPQADATPAPISSKPAAALSVPPAGHDGSVVISEPGSSAPASQAAAKPTSPDITTAVTEAALGQPPAPASKPAPSAPAAAAQIDRPPPSQAAATAMAARETPSASTSVPPAEPAGGKLDATDTKPAVLVLSVPAGHEEQAEVLQYVTGLTSEIARLRTENETLRKDLGRRMAEQDGRLADFNRRVSVAEARAAMRSAAEAGKSEDVLNSTAPRALQQAAGASIPLIPASETRPATTPANRLRYRVQAASPGLALLAEIGRGGGEGAQLQVAVGDQIPGYGVVKSVSQRGPSWVVQTEHGAID